VFKGHDVVLELNDNNLEGKNIFALEQAWFLKVGSNDGGTGELSFHFKIKINVGFIIS
jgi:hypothetical protein